MAKIDIINIKGNKERCLNLSHSVGLGGANHKSDLIMLQALFRYLYSDKEANLKGMPLYEPALALMKDFPVTGFLNVMTIQTIAYFQMAHRHRLLNVDGVIHPAHYEGRVIRETKKPLMTITYLHLLAKKRELKIGKGDYIASVKKIIALFHNYEVIAARMPKT